MELFLSDCVPSVGAILSIAYILIFLQTWSFVTFNYALIIISNFQSKLVLFSNSQSHLCNCTDFYVL